MVDFQIQMMEMMIYSVVPVRLLIRINQLRKPLLTTIMSGRIIMLTITIATVMMTMIYSDRPSPQNPHLEIIIRIKVSDQQQEVDQQIVDQYLAKGQAPEGKDLALELVQISEELLLQVDDQDPVTDRSLETGRVMDLDLLLEEDQLTDLQDQQNAQLHPNLIYLEATKKGIIMISHRVNLLQIPVKILAIFLENLILETSEVHQRVNHLVR